MLNIYGKQWHDLTSQDIEGFLQTQEIEETFFFEFKDDRLTSAGFAKEVSALANTYGGYIFIGVSDDKAIEGCSQWDEQRIHVTIHDSITPTPSFDVKRFVVDGKTIYVVRIDEGSEPPYITNKGSIFERLSSGSFAIKDSARLMHLYNKNEQRQKQILDAITIEPVSPEIDNVYGYIDIGLSVAFSDRKLALDAFRSADLKAAIEAIHNGDSPKSANISKVGYSIVYTPGGIAANRPAIPAHLNNFIEIMCDGSVRMRVLLINNDPTQTTVYMGLPFSIINNYQTIYSIIMGTLFPNHFVYAKKYEQLRVFKQFNPVFLFEPSTLVNDPVSKKHNEEMADAIREKRKLLGKDIVVTSNRIPKTGLYTIDHRTMQLHGIEDFSKESILNQLFLPEFAFIGYPAGYEPHSKEKTT